MRAARPHRLARSRTRPFQGRDTGSNPVGVTTSSGRLCGFAKAAMLALAAGAALGGCFDPGADCWNRELYQAAAQAPGGGPVHEIRAGTFPGEIAVEDPGNWWTGTRFTGESCRMEVEHRPEGTYVRAGFLDAAVRLGARMGP